MAGGQSIIEGAIAGGGQRLDKALADASGLSRERIKALLADGRIELAGKPASQPSLKPAEGTRFRIAVPEPVAAQALPQPIPLDIIYEDAHLLIVDKPAGLVVHPAAGNPDGTLVNALLHHCRGQLSGIGGVARPGIVHRIDKDTSGLLVVAKSDAAHEGLARQFADHSILRSYRALVAGLPLPPAGTVTGALGRSNTNRKKMAIVEDGRGKHAVTHYRTLEALNGSSLIECSLETDEPTRFAFTCRQSVIRYWGIRLMDAHLRNSGHCWQKKIFPVRRSMRRNLASSIPLHWKQCISIARSLRTCGLLSSVCVTEIDDSRNRNRFLCYSVHVAAS